MMKLPILLEGEVLNSQWDFKNQKTSLTLDKEKGGYLYKLERTNARTEAQFRL